MQPTQRNKGEFMKSKSTAKTIVADCDQCGRCRVFEGRDNQEVSWSGRRQGSPAQARARAGVDLRCKRSWRRVNDISTLVGSPQSSAPRGPARGTSRAACRQPGAGNPALVRTGSARGRRHASTCLCARDLDRLDTGRGRSACPRRRIFKIGHIEAGSPSSSPHLLAAFRAELRRLGYVEGENLFIERRYADRRQELPTITSELVQFGVDAIFTIGPQIALAASMVTDRIPIVFVGGGDPVEIGLVQSLARPGANVTGLTLSAVELAAKRIQLLKEAVPSADRVGILWNKSDLINKLELEEATRAGRTLALTLLPVEVRTPDEFERAFDDLVRDRAEAALLLSGPLIFPNRARLAKLALNARLPTMVPLREYAEAGFLISYGPSFADHCRRAATYVDQILKGAKPADLPVQLPTTLELVVNSKTAKTLGLTVPPLLLARADEVIE